MAERGGREDALTLIRQQLAAISDRMLSKTDTGGLMQEFRAVVREEMAALRTDLNAVEERVEALENEAQACQTQHRATELATIRQGNLLLTIRRHVEELEKRSRWHNIRIRTPHLYRRWSGPSSIKSWEESPPRTLNLTECTKPSVPNDKTGDPEMSSAACMPTA
ncbi:Hypothetical predicted protein [Pelobates cultripes]|uniref:Uncharacterized protein n=1 Tax=Pelobates cultripes TaxID=61616 RepID=A0AAD1WBM4_PELCU|nr:Hypothetical predicted protein [Pelobates cultripes]